MKKIIALLIVMTMCFSSICVFAANDEIGVYLEGNKISFDVPPQTLNDRTMVPIRAIFEAMGATVTWEESTQTAICIKENTTVKMTVDSMVEYINDVPYTMDVSPVIIGGRTLAPARYVAEAFGYNVNWDNATNSVLISKSNSGSETSQVNKPSVGYTNALKKAESYSETLHMSKRGIYDQLTSEYGEKFTAEEAQYAVDNLKADYKANALKKAESYSETLHMSKRSIYDQLTSEYGEKFTAEEAQYAVDNLKADYKANALKKAESYSETLNMSKRSIYDQLISEYGEKFTAEEAQYAIDHLKN